MYDPCGDACNVIRVILGNAPPRLSFSLELKKDGANAPCNLVWTLHHLISIMIAAKVLWHHSANLFSVFVIGANTLCNLA